MTPHANGFQSSFGSIVQINIKLLIAAGMAFFTYLAWPSSLAWWGFGLLSLYAGAMSVMLSVQAVKPMIKLHKRDSVIAAHMKLGHQPKSSTLANRNDLDDAGMR